MLENLHPLCKKHHQEKTQKRINVIRLEDGALAWEFPRIGTTLVYPPESRINQAHFEQLLEYFDTGEVDVSHSIDKFLAEEREARECTVHPEVAKRSEHVRSENAQSNSEESGTNTVQGSTAPPMNPWAPLNQQTNDDPPPF